MKKVIDAIVNEILTLAQALLESEEVGLRNSARNKDVEVLVKSYENPIVIETVFNNYLYYIESGLKPMSNQQPPMDGIRDWALAKNLPTDNSTLFMISNTIWRNGIEAQPILATLEEQIDERWQNEWADLIFEEIVKQLDWNNNKK